MPRLKVRTVDGDEPVLKGGHGQGVCGAGQVFGELNRCRGDGAAMGPEVTKSTR